MIAARADELIKTIQWLKENLAADIQSFADKTRRTLKAGNKILLFGNGGSAADAQHIAAELVGRYKAARAGLPALALTTNSSIITAIANDFSYEDIFSRQVEALAVKGDLAVGISTSGNSPNVAKALKTARDKGCYTVALLGGDGGGIKNLADLPITVASKNTPRVQECHILIGHIVCEIAES